MRCYLFVERSIFEHQKHFGVLLNVHKCSLVLLRWSNDNLRSERYLEHETKKKWAFNGFCFLLFNIHSCASEVSCLKSAFFFAGIALNAEKQLRRSAPTIRMARLTWFVTWLSVPCWEEDFQCGFIKWNTWRHSTLVELIAHRNCFTEFRWQLPNTWKCHQRGAPNHLLGVRSNGGVEIYKESAISYLLSL